MQPREPELYQPSATTDELPCELLDVRHLSCLTKCSGHETVIANDAADL